MTHKTVLDAVFIFLVLSIASVSDLQPIKAEQIDDLLILNIQVSPSVIKVGDNFSINATIVNNSNNTVSIHNGCGGPFLATFDDHVRSGVKKVCNWMAVQIILKPGQHFNATSLTSNLAYTAIFAGSANATMDVSYEPLYQHSLSNAVKSISKSFSFAILDAKAGHAELPPEQQMKSGVLAKDVKCNVGLQLVFKASDDSPKCVKPSSVDKLVSWGWALKI